MEEDFVKFSSSLSLSHFANDLTMDFNGCNTCDFVVRKKRSKNKNKKPDNVSRGGQNKHIIRGVKYVDNIEKQEQIKRPTKKIKTVGKQEQIKVSAK